MRENYDGDIEPGTIVAYSDMANPYLESVVTSVKGPYGSECLRLDGTGRSHVSPAAISGPGGWRMTEKPRWSFEQIEQLRQRVDAYTTSRALESNARHELARKGREWVEREAAGRWIILGEYRSDETDSQSDHFGHTTSDAVILGYSKHGRNLFPEMRKAAARDDRTAHLREAPQSAEHRENWSMGGGYYLKDGSRHGDGWAVLKVPLSYLPMHLLVSIGRTVEQDTTS